MKKFISILTLACIAATSMVGAAMPTASAADTMLFTYKGSDGSSTVNVDVSKGAQTVDCSVFITDYAPVYTMGLKMQFVGPDGTTYFTEDNKYFTGTKAAYGDPGNFTTIYGMEEDGYLPPSKLKIGIANAKAMNFVWQTNTLAEDEQTKIDAIFVPESKDENSFIDLSFTVAENTPAGTYTLDIRRDAFVLDVDPDTGKETMSSTKLSNIAGDAVAYDTVPLTVVVSDGSGSQGTTTTQAPIGTTTTKVTTTTDGGSVTPSGMRYEIGKVDGQPGETVSVPVYVYGDTGTAGITMRFDVDENLTLKRRKDGDAYTGAPDWNVENFDYVWNTGDGKNVTAADGAVITYLNFTLPADASGQYPIGFKHESIVVGDSGPRQVTESVDTNGKVLDITYVDGYINVGGGTTATTVTTVTTTTTTVTTVDVNPGEALPGDTNVDGKVSIADVVKLNKTLAGNDTLTAQGTKNADVNADTNVDQKDSLKIMQFLAKAIAQSELGKA